MYFVYLPEGGFCLDDLVLWKEGAGNGVSEGVRFWLRSRGEDCVYTRLPLAEFNRRVQGRGCPVQRRASPPDRA